MLWFESLLFYGCEEQSSSQKADLDVGLLPAIVERVILPKLAGRCLPRSLTLTLSYKPTWECAYPHEGDWSLLNQISHFSDALSHSDAEIGHIENTAEDQASEVCSSTVFQ